MLSSLVLWFFGVYFFSVVFITCLFFKMPSVRPRLILSGIGVMALAAAANFYRACLQGTWGATWSLILSNLLLLVALILFWHTYLSARHLTFACIGANITPQYLCDTGPFRRIRHPFYTSYLLAWWSTAFATGGEMLTLLMACLLSAIYVVSAHHEETHFLDSPLGTQYKAYRARAGMFYPRWV